MDIGDDKLKVIKDVFAGTTVDSLSGSVALTVLGYNLKRDTNDLDFISTEAFDYVKNKFEVIKSRGNFDEYSEDFYGRVLVKHIESNICFDVFCVPNIDYRRIYYNNVGINVTNISKIIEAKINCIKVNSNPEKHKRDIRLVCNQSFKYLQKNYINYSNLHVEKYLYSIYDRLVDMNYHPSIHFTGKFLELPENEINSIQIIEKNNIIKTNKYPDNIIINLEYNLSGIKDCINNMKKKLNSKNKDLIGINKEESKLFDIIFNEITNNKYKYELI